MEVGLLLAVFLQTLPDMLGDDWPSNEAAILKNRKRRCVTWGDGFYRYALKLYAVLKYRTIPKISPGAYIFQRPF